MCTLTWRRFGPDGSAGFELFFNRDEKRTRRAELPPIARRAGHGLALAPRDSEGGGSWIAVNDRGVAVALLNGYRASDAERVATESRGLLVLRLIAEDDREAVVRTLSALDLEPFRSFTLLAFDPHAGPAIARWDGASLAIDRDTSGLPQFVTSSSFSAPLVTARRRAEFDRVATERRSARLLDFHRGHAFGASAWSVCMHRPDAETRSLTRVRVDGRGVRLDWHAGSPCRRGAAVTATLPLQVRV